MSFVKEKCNKHKSSLHKKKHNKKVSIVIKPPFLLFCPYFQSSREKTIAILT